MVFLIQSFISTLAGMAEKSGSLDKLKLECEEIKTHLQGKISETSENGTLQVNTLLWALNTVGVMCIH